MNQATVERYTMNLALLRMYMVYRAMRDGWRVSRASGNRYVFSKQMPDPEQYSAEGFLHKYLVSH